MNNGDIDRFLSQLSPAQETVVLLREIRDLLKVRFTDSRPLRNPNGSLADYDPPALPLKQGKKR